MYLIEILNLPLVFLKWENSLIDAKSQGNPVLSNAPNIFTEGFTLHGLVFVPIPHNKQKAFGKHKSNAHSDNKVQNDLDLDLLNCR